MNTKKIMLVFGTRPEAIKMAPVVTELRRAHDVAVRVCVTGQHRQMLDQMLELFDIKPDHDLDIMKPGQDLSGVTTSVILGMRGILQAEKPDLVMVHGDTTTSFATALAAFYSSIPVAHVEAGLRTGNIFEPWPEEMNRRLTASLAHIHFAPTLAARENLLRENINQSTIHITGNTVIDALLQMRARIQSDTSLAARMQAAFSYLDPSKKLILVTGHRRENFGQGLEDICRALLKLAQRQDVEIVYPVHMNPNVRATIERLLSRQPRIHCIEPQDYLPFVYLLDRSYVILTDSGGIQEEAPALGKPVLVMRDTTERPEALHAGAIRLVGTSCERIVKACNSLLDGGEDYKQMAQVRHLYGDGKASDRIAAIVTGKHDARDL